MIRIFDKQSTGKTRKLLVYAKKNDCTVICSSPARMKDKAIRYELGCVQCVSYEDFLAAYKDGAVSDEKYVIDEPERLLALLFPSKNKFCGYDMTVAEEESIL